MEAERGEGLKGEGYREAREAKEVVAGEGEGPKGYGKHEPGSDVVWPSGSSVTGSK